MDAYNYIKFKSFKRLHFYAGSLHGRYGIITPGAHILFEQRYNDNSTEEVPGRVLGIVTRLPDGTQVKNVRRNPMLAVLVPSRDLHFGYLRCIPKDDVRAIFNPGAFARWFLFGAPCTPELAQGVSEYGAMCDSYLAKYLTAPEGKIREDWHEVAMGRSAPTEKAS